MRTIIQITDLHLDNNDPELKSLNPEDNFQEFITYADKIPCEEIILTGDVAEIEENFYSIIEKLQGQYGSVKYVAGNHDPQNEMLFNKKIPYFMEYMEEFLVLYLDSSKGIIDQEQLHWLNDLLMNNQKDILVFIHHPIVDCGNTVMDRKYPLKNRSEVYRMLENTGRKVNIFCGHYHWEQEVQSGNMKQYVTPSLLYQLDMNADILRIGSMNFGFRVINISMDKVETYVETLTRKSLAPTSD